MSGQRDSHTGAQGTATESSAMGAKRKRQAQQASIIIEELERALGHLSMSKSRNRGGDEGDLVDDDNNISNYEEDNVH